LAAASSAWRRTTSGKAAGDDAGQGLDTAQQRATVIFARQPLSHEVADPAGGDVGDDSLQALPDFDPHPTGAGLPVLPRDHQQHRAGVAGGVSHLRRRSHTPRAPDLPGDVHLVSPAYGRKRDHRDLGAGGRLEPLGEVGDPGLGGLIHHAGDVGDESGGTGRKEGPDRGVLRQEAGSAELKRRQERDSFGWCPAQ
jgi:hypothetical protein